MVVTWVRGVEITGAIGARVGAEGEEEWDMCGAEKVGLERLPRRCRAMRLPTQVILASFPRYPI